MATKKHKKRHSHVFIPENPHVTQLKNQGRTLAKILSTQKNTNEQKANAETFFKKLSTSIQSHSNNQ